MALHNDPIHNILRRVTPNVYYFHNRNDDSEESNKLPYIVFQIISKRPIARDDIAELYRVEYQISVSLGKKRSLDRQVRTNASRSWLHSHSHKFISKRLFNQSRLQVEIISKGGY